VAEAGVSAESFLTERPARWLPAEFKNYDELLSTAADRAAKNGWRKKPTAAIRTIGRGSGSNYLEMLYPIGRDGILKKAAEQIGASAIGDTFSPRAASRHQRPIGAFCGESGGLGPIDPADSRGTIRAARAASIIRINFSYWFEGQPIYEPFSDAAEAKVKRHVLTLKARELSAVPYFHARTSGSRGGRQSIAPAGAWANGFAACTCFHAIALKPQLPAAGGENRGGTQCPRGVSPRKISVSSPGSRAGGDAFQV